MKNKLFSKNLLSLTSLLKYNYCKTKTVLKNKVCNILVAFLFLPVLGFSQNSTPHTSATATPDTICPGNSSVLTGDGGTLGDGANWYWYIGSCGETLAGTGLSTTQSPTATTLYYVRAEGTSNTTTCASTTITVNTTSTAATSATGTTPICYGSSTTLGVTGGSLGTGANWSWYSGSCGGTYVISGASPVLSPTATIVYYARAEGICDTTTCVSITITVDTLSTAATSATGTTPICSGSTTTLGVTGGSLGTGANWYWYTESCGGIYITSGSTPILSPETTTTYYVRAEGICDTTTCVSATVTVYTLSTTPTSATGITPICLGSTTTLEVIEGGLGTGANWYWYTGSCGGTYVISGTSRELILNPETTTTYYVRAEGICDTTTCVSAIVTVYTLSTAPTSATGTTPICSGSTTTLGITGGSLGTGANWYWYTGSCGGTYVISGASPVLSPETTIKYYVKAQGVCNTTTCVSVTIIVNALSTAATSISGSTTICSGSTTNLRIMGGSLGTGANWYWYTGSCGGTYVLSGTTPVISPEITTTYYVRAEGICDTTTCVSITITVDTLSTAATSASGTTPICSGSTTTLGITGGSLGTGANWSWYSGSCGGTYVISVASPVLSPTATIVYYARAEGICDTTTCVSITITVDTLSTAATSATGTTPICSGSTTTLGVTGGSLGTGANWYWYTGSCEGTQVGTGLTITKDPSETITYFVRAEGTCNTTACSSITVIVYENILSVIPNSVNANPDTLTSGTEGGTTLEFSGGSLGSAASWKWYSGSCGGKHVGTNTTITQSPLETTIYYIRAEGVCNTTNCLSTTVTVMPVLPYVNGDMWRINGDGLIRGKVGIGFRNMIAHPSSTLNVYGNISSANGSNFKVENGSDTLLNNTEFSALKNVGTTSTGTLRWSALYANAGANPNNYAGTFNGIVQVGIEAIEFCPDYELIVNNIGCNHFVNTEFSALKHFAVNNYGYYTSLYAKQGDADFAAYYDGRVWANGFVGIGNTISSSPIATLEITGYPSTTGSPTILNITDPINFQNTKFSALTHSPKPHYPSYNFSTALYAKQGGSQYAGWFDGTMHVQGVASIGDDYSFAPSSSITTFEIFGNCGNTGGRNFKVTNNLISGMEFSSITDVTNNNIWAALYANSGTTSGNYAGYFDGTVKIKSLYPLNTNPVFEVLDGGISCYNTSHDARITLQQNGGHQWSLVAETDGFEIFAPNNNNGHIFGIDNNGNIGINISAPSSLPWNAKLNVGGDTKIAGILTCQEVIVQAVVNVPDYVFEKEYKLMSLSDVEKYVKENKHLPEIPSAEEFKKNGSNMQEMDNALLKKIEELTLYMIDLKKENEQLKERISKLEK